ncbi:hypothetical protein MTBGP_09730 [Moorella thermoacetica]|uniref:hypothetical protein n=1 Tax=Neomoorella thermoacetica TaxID=1525 RepID=UPI0030D4122D
MASTAEYLVKSKELAQILGITQRRVNQLTKEGVLEKDSKGFFDLTKAVPAYVDYVTVENDELRREKILHERAKRRKAELQLKVMEGELHYGKDVERVMNHMLSTFRARILGMAHKLAPQLLMLDNIGVIVKIIDREAREALTELSNYDPALFLNDEVMISEEE